MRTAHATLWVLGMGSPPLLRVVTLCELPELSMSFPALCRLYFELINNLKSCDCDNPGRGDAALDGVGRHAETAPGSRGRSSLTRCRCA